MDACSLLPQHVLAVIPLIEGVQMQWLVLGFSAVVAAHMYPQSM